ncbi:unnamed protein product [Paramecium octaurelia]|uniref:Uncharacterized protein n=1 Tax=Paramecium octaurelia TaxID=43137 RepID=A0A8S1SBR9_PAROT|nr:unnamed protein product [Paramecium octaurelia]
MNSQIIVFILLQIAFLDNCLIYEPDQLIFTSAYDEDQFKDVWDISLNRNQDFDDVQTYAYGFWLKYSFVYPKYLEQQKDWHSISRLTTRQNHTDYQNPLDRALSVWLSKDFYHFTTYTTEYPEKFYNAKYEREQLDGKWTFIYFGYSYQEFLARGYVLFDDGKFEEALIPAKHYRLDFLRFLIKREFNNYAFNGFYCNIFLLINEQYPITEEELKIYAYEQYPLLFNLNEIFQQQTLLEHQEETFYDKQLFKQFVFSEIDPQQYSISGWLKFNTPIEFKDHNLILRLSHSKVHDQGIFDKIFYLISNDQGYEFESYNCIEDCKMINWSIPTEDQEKQWHFVYIAYDANRNKIFQFWKFEEKAFVIHHEQIRHFQLHGIYINLQKDEYDPGFNGYLKRWTFNYGAGAYQENGYEDDQILQAQIGLIDFNSLNKTETWKFQQSNLNIDINLNQDLQENEIDPSHFQTNSFEYGYGFWMRFLYNSPSKIDSLTNQTLGLSRFGTTQQYKQNNNLGESTLSVYIQNNRIQFESYSVLDKQQKQFYIKTHLDNEWLYLYTGYKRIYKEQGVFLGCIYNIKGVNKCTNSQNDIVHYLIDNYLFFSIGSIGSRFQDIKHFNGDIQDASLYFGKDSIIPKFNKQKAFPENIASNNWIFKQVEQFTNDRLDKMPSEYKLNDVVSEYGVQLWFKSIGKTDNEFQFIFLLSTDEYRDQISKPGDITLGVKMDQNNNLYFLSYSYDKDDYMQQQEKKIEVENEQDKKQWTYIYYGHKKHVCLYFIQTKTKRVKNSFECLHHASKYFLVYKGFDGKTNDLLGDIDYFKVDFGLGSFQSQFHHLTEAFKQGLKLFPTSFEWKGQFNKIISVPSIKSGFQQVFASNQKISMDGQRNYGYGFWSRYLREYPELVQQEDKEQYISISNLYCEQTQNKELEIISLYLSQDKKQYKVKTYDLNTHKYQIGTFQLLNQQENVWNYIYLSYNADKQQVVGFIHHYKEKRVIRVILKDISHKSINGKVNFNLGRFLNYEGFNGQISNLIIRFDGNAVVDNIQQFQTLVDSSKQIESNEKQQVFKFITLNEEAQFSQHNVGLKENYFPEEYSVYGWFRPNPSELNKQLIQDNVIKEQYEFDQVVLQLSSCLEQNEEQRFRFQIRISQNGYQFVTYSINEESPAISWIQNILLDANFGTWCYFWMGYSQKLQQINVYFKIIDSVETKVFNYIQHHLTNKFILLLSSQVQDRAFNGDLAQIGMEIGNGAFKEKANLPEFELKLIQKAYQFKDYEGDFDKLNRLNLIQGKNDLIGSTQYTVQLWTRWLNEISDDSFLDQNSIFRFSRNQLYENCDEKGDRTLMVIITTKSYEFSTYNVVSEQCSESKEISYQQLFEGQWNLIYFAYSNTQDFIGAKGFVYFSKTGQSKDLQFNVEHLPLTSQAVLTVGQREFSYGKFFGQMHDIQVKIGYGFEDDITSILETTTIPDLETNQFNKHNLVQFESRIDQLVNKKFKSNLNLERQYSLYGWFKYDGMTEYGQFSILARVSTEPLLSKKLSDQTFLILVNQHTIQFKSYNLLPQYSTCDETFEIIKNYDFVQQEKQQWVFFYFGYNFDSNSLQIYLKYNEDLHDQQELLQNIYHYLPLQFYVFIGEDDIYSKYSGLIDDINLLTGQSSYIDSNIYQQFGSLNQKYIENVLK